MDTFLAWARMNGRGPRLGVGALLVMPMVFLIIADQRGLLAGNDAPRLAQPYDASPAPEPVAIGAPKLAQAYSAAPAVSAPVAPPRICQRPLTPMGFSWPETASYLKGYPKHATNGHSVVHVDNLQGASDVLVKLASTSGPTASPVRVFYIPAHGEFTAANLPAGTYDVRFCSLSDGSLSRSDSITLEEIPDADGRGVHFTHYDLTLYTVMNGNVQMHPLNPADF